MNGIDKKYLIDSNILIYHFNGVEAATDFLRNNLPNCYISRLTFIEVLSFDFGKADQDVILFLKQFHIVWFLFSHDYENKNRTNNELFSKTSGILKDKNINPEKWQQI